MGHITGEPLEQALSCFLEAAVLPELMPRALDALAKSMNARGALLSTPTFSRRGNPVSAGIDDSFSAYMEQGWDRIDERAQRGVEWYRAHGAGFFCEDMLFSRDELAKSNYFQGFAKKQDVPWFAAAPLVGDAVDYVAIAFNRRASEGHFTRRDIARLNRILPSFQAAGRVCQASAAARERGMLLGLGLIDRPAYLLDWQGLVIDQNDCGAAFLGSVLRVSFGRLTASHQQLRVKIDKAVALAVSARDGENPQGTIVGLGSEAYPTRAQLQIMRIAGNANDVFQRAKAIAIVSDPKDGETSNLSLELVYGLSPREREVAILLAKGMSIRHAATLLGIGEGTARFYVKSILSKTGTHRQAELVRLLLAPYSGDTFS